MAHAAPPEPLLERDDALAAVRALTEQAAERRGSLVVIEGRAGEGKTRLLERACELAAERGIALVRARGDDLEQDFGWGGCLQLLQGALAVVEPAQREALLQGPGAPAARLLEGGRGDDVDLPLLHAIAWVLSSVAAARPLLVAVDDAHWLDAPSLRALLFCAGRTGAIGAGIVVARRVGERNDREELVERLATHSGARTLTLAPLGDAAVAELVAEALPDADAKLCAACARATGGNPFYVGQLVSAIAESGQAPDPERIEALAPVSLRRHVVVRLRRLGDDAVALARSVAVLADGAPLALAAAVAGLAVDRAAGAAGVLADSDLLASGAALAFVHPLVRSAVAPEGAELARDHTRAAEVLREHRAAPEEVCAQLLHSVPGALPWAAATLREGAERALKRAAPSSAAAYLRRALEEPLDEEQRAETLIALGRAAAAAGDDAAPHLEAALELVDDEARVAQVLGELGWSLHHAGRFADAADAFIRARTHTSDPAVERELQAGEIAAALLSPAHSAAAHEQVRALLAQPSGELTAAERLLLSGVVTQQLFVTTPARELLDVARRIDVMRVIDEETADTHTVWHVVGLLSWCDAPETEDVLDAVFADARRRASVLAFAMSSYARAWPRYWAGRLDEAAADAQAAVDAWAGGMEMYLPGAAYWLVVAQIDRGATDEAIAALDRVGAAERWPDAMRMFVYAATARIAAAQGRHADALAGHLQTGATLASFGASNPTVMAWRSEAALAAFALGEAEQARALADEELALARRFGAPRALGVALRAHGLVHGDEATLREAVDVLSGSVARLEYVRALIALGVVLRRHGKRVQAREPLRDALAIAHDLGARRLGDQAREELIAAGARPRRAAATGLDALTPAERRVAALAAAGRSNREIAGELFVTLATVEWHLRQTYGKLGIASRRELPVELAA